MTVREVDGAAAPRRASAGAMWAGLLALGFTILSASAMRGVFSPVQEVVKGDLLLTDFQLSLVQGLAASIPIALLSLPLGRITDRGNRKQLLLALGLTWTIGTVATAFASEFYGLFFARMLAGIGAMCAIPVAISIAADLSAPEHRGRSLLLLSLGNMAGAAAAFAFGGAILGALRSTPIVADLAPWRGMHLAFAAASTALLAPLLLLREPARQEVGETVYASLKPALRAIWRRRALLAPLFIGQVSVVMADTAAAIWAAPVLSRNYGLAPEQFAGWMGLTILASGVLGSLMGGVLADAGHRSRIEGGILLAGVIAAVLSIPGAAFPLMPDATGFAWMLALFLTCGSVTGLVTATAVAVLIPNEIRGVCLSAFMVLGAIVGLGVAPTLVTLVSDAIGGEGALRYALAITGAVTSVAAALGFGLAMLRARRRPLAGWPAPDAPLICAKEP